MKHKTIESVLERGENLDNLVERSNTLSAQSKMFYKTAKKVGVWIEYSADFPAKLLLHCHVIIIPLAAMAHSYEGFGKRMELYRITLRWHNVVLHTSWMFLMVVEQKRALPCLIGPLTWCHPRFVVVVVSPPTTNVQPR